MIRFLLNVMPRYLFFPAGKILLAFAIWIYLFRPFFTGAAVISDDTFSTYANIKYILDNFKEGVYPLWNPFTLWGVPADITTRQMGEFNPYMGVILLFYWLGAGFYPAFLVTMTGYFFCGAIGFYLLSKEVLEDEGIAFTAFLFFLFSSVGFSLFNQINMVLLYVPAVWLFYFFLKFVVTWQQCYCFGLTFCLAIILTTYLPFYFLTVFLLSAILFCVLFFSEFKNIMSGFTCFLRKQAWTIVICTTLIGVALIPPLISYQSVQSADMAIQTRHTTDAATYKKGAAMAYEEIKRGGLSDKMSWRDLFFNLRELSFLNDGAVFLPLFLFTVMATTMFVAVNRKIIFLGLLALTLFFIALTDASPVHRFLYERIFYFRYFRNLYFLLPFLISVVILLACVQLKQFIRQEYSCKAKAWVMAGTIVVIHGVFAFVFFRQEDVGISTWLTFGGSLGIFLALIFGRIRKAYNPKFFILLSVFILAQPFDILATYAQNAAKVRAPIIREALQRNYTPISFSFSRPEYNSAQYQDDDTFNSYHRFNAYVLSREDSPGFIAFRYGYPTRWSYYVFQNIPETDYRSYLCHKFLLYDNIAFLRNPDIGRMARNLRGFENLSYVFDENLSQDLNGQVKSSGHAPQVRAITIDQNSSLFRVLSFNVNRLSLETNFDLPKFLVYLDSYHQNWKAFINGREVPIQRANVAFKGLWVPPGQARVDFRFMPLGSEALYFSIQGLFAAFFIYTVALFIRKEKKTA